jgi:hypothetical protein
VLVNNGSQADIIFLHAFDRMGISHSLLKPADNPLYGFGGKGTFLVGVTEPPKSLGPPTVVLVQRTSDNPIGAPESLDKFGICFSYLSQEHFTRHADITNHQRYENAEAIT